MTTGRKCGYGRGRGLTGGYEWMMKWADGGRGTGVGEMIPYIMQPTMHSFIQCLHHLTSLPTSTYTLVHGEK
jgi:hypothetical protein